MKLLGIGFGNLVNSDRIIAIVEPDSNPVKRLVSASKEKAMLIDATLGRKTKSVIIMDSDHIILSYLSAKSLNDKLHEEESI